MAIVATGCDDPRAARPVARARETPGHAEHEVALGGSVSGRVVWAGPLPEPVVARGSMDEEVCGTEARVPVLEVGPRGGVAGSVVVLSGEGLSGLAENPTDPAVLRVDDCSFSPHVLVLGRGARLRVENADPVMHDARATDGRGILRFDLGLATAGTSSELTLEEPGVLRVVDDAGHPGMLAWVHVVEHRYFAVTDAEGRFRIEAIPPGTYSVQMWHEGVRPRDDGSISAAMLLSRTVTILGGHDTSVDFELDATIAEAAGD